MTSDQGHGVDVKTDSLLAALEPTRIPRHALDVLWAGFPWSSGTVEGHVNRIKMLKRHL